MSSSTSLLEITDLRIGVSRAKGSITIVDGVSLDVAAGDRLGVVGESGSGKTMALRAVAGLLPRGVDVLSGSIRYDGQELVGLAGASHRKLMGPQIAMIFQEPMTALNPVQCVGDQIAEGPMRHRGMRRREARKYAVELMARTGIPDPARRAEAYPHELSGGLRQRVVIAMAVSCQPRLLLCDEPTTALDVTVQHQVLSLLESLCDEVGAALMFVTHDLAVVNQTCRRIAVMYSGRIVESGLVKDVLHDPRHPYTEGLLASAPDFDHPDRDLFAIPGFPPNIANRPGGCDFAPRCAYRTAECDSAKPVLLSTGDGRTSACVHVDHMREGAFS